MFHDKCGERIAVDITNNILVLAIVGIRNLESLNVQEIFVRERLTKIAAESLSFYCTYCDEKIEIKNINAHCSYCHSVKKITDLKIVKRGSGVYCSRCIKENEIDKKDLSPLEDAFKTIVLG